MLSEEGARGRGPPSQSKHPYECHGFRDAGIKDAASESKDQTINPRQGCFDSAIRIALQSEWLPSA